MTFADATECIPGYRFIGRTKDDLWGKWVIDDGHYSTPEQRHQWRLERTAKRHLRQQQEQQRRAAALPASERDRHYRQLLTQLVLNPIDRADLIRRGLTDAEIVAWGVVSVEQWHRLGIELPHTLPGVNLDGHSLNTQPGYLCPIVDVAGYLVGCQLRLRSGDTRYVWLTGKTKKRPNGPTAHLPNGELPLAVHRPAVVKRQAIALVEGVGAKPRILALRRGQVVVGAAGGQFNSSPQTLEATLKQLSAELGTTTIEFYPDAGAIHNPHVLRQYRSTWRRLQQLGYSVEIQWWGQILKEAPDADELTDYNTIESITIEQFNTLAQQSDHLLTRLLKLLDRGKGQRKPPARQPAIQPMLPPASTAHIQEYQPGERLRLYQQAIEQGYRFILDSSWTGTGKSFDAGQMAVIDFQVKQLIYASDQHRNPTVETLDISNGWVDLEARHGGLAGTATVSGGVRWQRSQLGEIPDVPANCNRNRLIGALRTKHVSGADTASLICGTCPLREACTHANGPGYGFLNQRRSALSSPKLRAHPDSLPAPEDYDYASVVMLWDEPGQNFRVKQDVQITLHDLQQTITTLIQFPTLFERLQPLLVALLSYLDGSTRCGKFGLDHRAITQLLPMPTDLDIAAVEQALRPDLSFLNTTAQHGVDLADLPAALRKQFSERDGDMAQQAEQHVVKQWLPDLLRVLTGEQLGTARLHHRTLTLSLPNSRHRAIALAAQANVFFDATLSRDDLALKLGVHPEEILEVRQAIPDQGNLTLTQVMDMGRLGMQRGADQQRRVAAIIQHYQSIDPDTKVIDFKQFTEEGMGAWWRDSRGVNDFEQVKTLILCGTPCRNLADLQAEYAILTGVYDPEDAGFAAFVDRAIAADIQQAIGRLRAHRRADEQLEIILLSNFVLNLPTQPVLSTDITPEAASKQERLVWLAQAAIKRLQEQGQKVTQRAVAAIAGCTQARISQLWELINFAMGNSKSEIYNQADAAIAPEVEQLVGSVIENATVDELLQSLPEMFFEWLEPGQWGQVWRSVSIQQQAKVLSVLLLLLPPRQFSFFA
jgi:hypothetical protein